jgi:hypothetical protein
MLDRHYRERVFFCCVKHHEDDSTLPPGWKSKESKRHPGTYYYYNRETGEKSWERPIYQGNPLAGKVDKEEIDSKV